MSTLLAWLETNEAIRTQKLTRERLEGDYSPEEFRRRIIYEVEKSVFYVMKSIEDRVLAAVKAELAERQFHAWRERPSVLSTPRKENFKVFFKLPIDIW